MGLPRRRGRVSEGDLARSSVSDRTSMVRGAALSYQTTRLEFRGDSTRDRPRSAGPDSPARAWLRIHACRAIRERFTSVLELGRARAWSWAYAGTGRGYASTDGSNAESCRRTGRERS